VDREASGGAFDERNAKATSDEPPADVATAGEPEGSASPRRPTLRGSRPPHRRMPVWQESILLVGMALVLALVMKTFFLQAFYIPSGSMRDTLNVNDRILVEKWSYWFGDVHRGDIVVFDDPAHWLAEEAGSEPSNVFTKVLGKIGLYPTGGHLVKRVIGVGGDHVTCTKRGALEVNGQVLHEKSYVTLASRSCDTPFSVVVPPGRLWVMGDNRENSADSRAHQGDPGGGFIPTHDVVGKVFVVVWPPRHWSLIHRPSTFDNPALDNAAAFVTVSVPAGLALVVVLPLLRRARRRVRADGDD
jgi:signal peptidase I